MRGKTINIYIQDGENPRGVKICDIKTSIVKAIFIPRNQLQQAIENNKKDLQKPGIYFLFGENNTTKPITYIGEAEVISDRLKQHNQKKDFWNIAICFMSDKDNLNKAHIKHLENYSYNEAIRINKCLLENSVNPTQSFLDNQEKDFILDFFDDLKLIISVLGYPIFDENKLEKENILYCKGKLADAFGEYIEDGFVVFKGSKANMDESPTIGSSLHQIRSILEENNIIKKSGDVFIFQENYKFNSLSTAAVVVLGRRANGWTEWKYKNGKTIDEVIRKQK